MPIEPYPGDDREQTLLEHLHVLPVAGITSGSLAPEPYVRVVIDARALDDEGHVTDEPRAFAVLIPAGAAVRIAGNLARQAGEATRVVRGRDN